MAEAKSKNKGLSTNIYFGAAFIILVLTTVSLIFMLNNQKEVNLQASLLLENAEEYKELLNQQRVEIRRISREIDLTSLETVLPESEMINELTRMFDSFFSSLPGVAFNPVLSYTESQMSDEIPGLMYTDATLSITSSEDNFFEFLRYIEKSGISAEENNRLMEIRSINISFTEGEALSYRVILRIYFSA